jgi:ADP-dependent NAD(P)H-hydrate dehydratase / NAD(P)H-hydrate epimerase
VLSGGPGRTGAARLAARAALRIGAGLVTIAVPPGAQQEVACQITAIMLTRVADAEALGVVLEDKRYSALCLGPGLGVGERTRSLVSEALSAGRSVVLDADALTSFADDPMSLFEQVRGADVVLTPHGGEFARLFPDLAEQLKAVAETGPAVSKIDVVRTAAARAGCTVLLKGADTVIAAPDGRVRVHAACRERAAPWLATAGAGDVLAGFVTGLMARGLEPLEAASHATWLHVECARAFGPGLIAEDLPEALPGVLKALL